VRRSFSERGGPDVVKFVDDTLPFGTTDYSVPVQKLKDANVDLLVSCLDVNGTINLGREGKKQGLEAPMYVRNGYEVANVQANAEALEGAYLGHFFAPIEYEPASKGMADFKEWIAKVDGAAPGEQTLVGWLNADLFYRALVAAGPEFTRSSVVAAANQITDWNGDGIVHGFDWTKAHDQAPDPWCTAYVQVKAGKFVPVFTEPGKPFVCFPLTGPIPEEPVRA
jgi:ABC-type branched-subunit amino acid transport system substrate-binding protein